MIRGQVASCPALASKQVHARHIIQCIDKRSTITFRVISGGSAITFHVISGAGQNYPSNGGQRRSLMHTHRQKAADFRTQVSKSLRHIMSRDTNALAFQTQIQAQGIEQLQLEVQCYWQQIEMATFRTGRLPEAFLSMSDSAQHVDSSLKFISSFS